MSLEHTVPASARPAGERQFTARELGLIRIGFFGTLVTLVAQFLLGMGVNLFVTIPADHVGANPPDLLQSLGWAIFHGPIVLVLHVVLGLLVVLSGFTTVFRVIAMRAPRRLSAAAIIGAVSLLFAAASGAGFVAYNEDIDSMAMASFFAIAVLSYLYGLFATSRSNE